MRKAILFSTFLFMAICVPLLAMDLGDYDNEPLIGRGFTLSSEEQAFVNVLAKKFVDSRITEFKLSIESLIPTFEKIDFTELPSAPENEGNSDHRPAVVTLQHIQKILNKESFIDNKITTKALTKYSDNEFLEAWNYTQCSCYTVNCLGVHTAGSFLQNLLDGGFGLSAIGSAVAVNVPATSCLLPHGIVCLGISAFYTTFRIGFACRGWELYREREEWLASSGLRPHILKAAIGYAHTLNLDEDFSQLHEEIENLIKKLKPLKML